MARLRPELPEWEETNQQQARVATKRTQQTAETHMAEEEGGVVLVVGEAEAAEEVGQITHRSKVLHQLNLNDEAAIGTNRRAVEMTFQSIY